MRLKTLQKRIDKIYENDDCDFRGEYIWCEWCKYRVKDMQLGFMCHRCTATAEQRKNELPCAVAYREWEKGQC